MFDKIRPLVFWPSFLVLMAAVVMSIIDLDGFLKGFDLLQGILMAVRQLEKGEARVENQYARVVPEHGNPVSLAAIAEVYESDIRFVRVGQEATVRSPASRTRKARSVSS